MKGCNSTKESTNWNNDSVSKHKKSHCKGENMLQ
jgi:hypothetical protein